MGGNFFEGFATGAIVAGASIGLGRAVGRIQQGVVNRRNAAAAAQKKNLELAEKIKAMFQKKDYTKTATACNGCMEELYKALGNLEPDWVKKANNYLQSDKNKLGKLGDALDRNKTFQTSKDMLIDNIFDEGKDVIYKFFQIIIYKGGPVMPEIYFDVEPYLNPHKPPVIIN